MEAGVESASCKLGELIRPLKKHIPDTAGGKILTGLLK